jgi:hypothetical protein
MRGTAGLIVGLAWLVGAAGCGSGGTPAASGGAGTSGAAGAGSGAAGAGSGAAGTGSGAGTTGAAGAELSLEPTPAGATWTYATTATGPTGTVAGTKTVTVEASEPVPGKAGVTAWRLHTVVPGSEDQLTWQAEVSGAIVRYRDDVFAAGGTTSLVTSSTYAPSKLRIDTTAAHLVAGATYSETYTETLTDATMGNATSSTSKPFRWKVVSAAESVTVPAGTFMTVHTQKSNGNSGAVDKDYWFARGVGKVKETSSAGRSELLSSYHLP